MPKPYSQIFNELRYGAAAQEADDALMQCVAGVKATGKQATLTVRITLKPPSKSGINYIEIIDEVIAKIPEPDRPSSVFFPTADNGLSKQDPRQQSLALGTVDRQTGEIIDAEVGVA